MWEIVKFEGCWWISPVSSSFTLSCRVRWYSDRLEPTVAWCRADSNSTCVPPQVGSETRALTWNHSGPGCPTWPSSPSLCCTQGTTAVWPPCLTTVNQTPGPANLCISFVTIKLSPLANKWVLLARGRRMSTPAGRGVDPDQSKPPEGGGGKARRPWSSIWKWDVSVMLCLYTAWLYCVLYYKKVSSSHTICLVNLCSCFIYLYFLFN